VRQVLHGYSVGDGEWAVTPQENRDRVAKWRAENPERSKDACRSYHAEHRERILERKRLYYQRTRKLADQTEEGRFRERDKKARRRAQSSGGKITSAQWDAILARHNHCCAYCGTGELPLEMDHVVALSKGGEHIASNIAPACKPCNSRKGAR
jgi:5-methylcytosine-specific restriction endonuclease McrA